MAFRSRLSLSALACLLVLSCSGGEEPPSRVSPCVFSIDHEGGLRLIDASDPTSPSSIYYTTLMWGSLAIDVVASGNYAYLASVDDWWGYDGHIDILDISDESNLNSVGHFYIPSKEFGGMCTNGQYLYLAFGNSVRIIDVSNPGAPTDVSGYDFGDRTFDPCIQGHYLYLANSSGGLRILDVGFPSGPVEVGSYPTPAKAYYLFVSGNYAYLVLSSGYMLIVDISNPTHPVGRGMCLAPVNDDYNGAIFVEGDYAYAVASGAGLHILDVSNPIVPKEIGTWGGVTSTYDIGVRGRYAYLGCGYSGLRIVDISKASNPTELGSLENQDMVYTVFVLD